MRWPSKTFSQASIPRSFAGTAALFVCATETKTAADIDAFVAAFAEVMGSDQRHA